MTQTGSLGMGAAEQARASDGTAARAGRWRRWAPVALTLAAGLVASLAAFAIVRGWERDHARLDFERRVFPLAASIQGAIDERVAGLHARHSFFEIGGRIDRRQFRGLVSATIVSHPTIRAIEWIPRVPDSERAAYEAAARADGYPDFQFVERDARGELVRAARRPEYFPVYYVEPFGGNEAALGFDLASEATRLAALGRARDTGEPTATARVRLVQEREAQFGFLVFVPVYRPDAPHDTVEDRRRRLWGFVLGVFRVGDLVEAAVGRLDTTGIEIEVADALAVEGERLLYRRPPREGAAIPRDRVGPARLEWRSTFDVAERRWSLTFRPTKGYPSHHVSWAWTALFGGLAGTALVAAYLGRAIGRAGQLADAKERIEAVALENARLYRETETRLRHTEALQQEVQRAYEELSRTQGQLVQAQKMEAVGRLAGGVAHDFNNLMTVVAGRASLLRSKLGDDDPRCRHVDLIQKTAVRATRVTRQLLAFSRKQVLEPRVVDLNALVAHMGAMLRPLIGEDVELVTVPAAELWPVRVDPGQLEQVLMNLAVNARDAMPRGGRLTVETANVVLDESYAAGHVGLVPGAYVMLAVSDTGCGMDAETLAHVFEPFFTTKGPGQGTGLGLATVYGIVKQSGGYVYAYSEPGLGTTFKIYLPRVEAPLDAEEGNAPALAVPRGSETVLLVEDEQAVRELIAEILESLGYRVLVAEDGHAALRISEHSRGQIGVVLTDVVMPRMSGPEMARRLEAAQPGIRVLYMSGYTDGAIVHHGVLDPGAAFLQKPFTPASVGRKVREVLDGVREPMEGVRG